jgi:hypothetical protein
MRINIYAQEITDRIEIVRKAVENTGASSVGLRFYLESPNCLKPPAHPDDDLSAITFWVHSDAHGFRLGDQDPLLNILREAIHLLEMEESV